MGKNIGEKVVKKILFFHHYNSPVGAGLSFLHILQALDETEYEVTVCLPDIEGGLDQKIKALGIRVIYSNYVIPYMHFSGSNMHYLSKRNFDNCRQISKAKGGLELLIQEEDPDCVAVNSLTLFWVGEIAKKLGKKTLCFHRETYARGLFGWRSKSMKKQLALHFNGIAFLSYYDLKETPQGQGKYVRITDKVDVVAYERLNKIGCRNKLALPQEEKLILYLGGISQLKGPLTAIKAMKWVKDAKLVFLQYQPKPLISFKDHLKYLAKILLGKNLEYKIFRLIQRDDLKDRIIFRPATDCAEEYFAACDAVIFPSMQAHQARPIYEAGIARKPIVVTDFVNTREFLDETNGWLFKKGDAKMLSKKIKETFLSDATIKVQKNYERAILVNNLQTLSKELSALIEIVFMGESK